MRRERFAAYYGGKKTVKARILEELMDMRRVRQSLGRRSHLSSI